MERTFAAAAIRPGRGAQTARQVFLYLLLAFLGALVLYPLFWLVMSSLKTLNELYARPLALPARPVFENFAYAWKQGLSAYFLNSVVVSVGSVLGTVFLGALAAYSLARFQFGGKTLFFYIIIGGLTLAGEVALFPLFRILQKIRLYDTYWAMIIPYMAFRLPFVTFLIRSYFLSFPAELEEAAHIDGLGSFQIFLRIVLPLSKPILASAAIMTLLFSWNEFLFALVFVEKMSLKTIPVGLINFKGQLRTDFVSILAGVAISMIPVVALFLAMQKSFIKGLTAGSTKG
jgi:raffinose/stachyose/melibiose transport system permease protein